MPNFQMKDEMYEAKGMDDTIQAHWLSSRLYNPLQNLYSHIPFIRRNFWVNSNTIEFAHWRIQFASNQSRQITNILNFIEHILETGRENSIFNIEQIHGFEVQPRRWWGLKQNTYIRYLHDQVKKTSKLPLFTTESLSDAKIISKLFYYQEINGLINLYKSSDMEPIKRITYRAGVYTGHIDEQQDFSAYRVSVPPLIVSGSEITIQSDNTASDTFYLDIILPTDIWFPWVVGFMEKEPATTPDTLYDNRQLAFRHTQKLNAFLSQIKSAAEHIDANWLFDPHMVYPIYASMVSENGIVLNGLEETR